MPYRCCFAVDRHEEQRMRGPTRTKQSDLFSAPATLPRQIPAVMRAELVNLLSALLWEAVSHQHRQHSAAQETADEQQDHA
jgi:hypothetical protein